MNRYSSAGVRESGPPSIEPANGPRPLIWATAQYLSYAKPPSIASR